MVVRSEGCLKGAQYQNIWMYIIHELEDAINDCNNGDLTANDGGPHAWDEGWAFYAGSLEGPIGTGDGQLIYSLAEKRCENFGTCTGDDDGSNVLGLSAVNAKLLDLFADGQTGLLEGKCDDVVDIKDQIVDLMTIPLVQGVLRYFYLADPEGGNSGSKAEAELWAFAASVLPRINECNADTAAIIRTNTDLASPNAPMVDGYVAMKKELESVYSCLGFSCSDVGGFLTEGDSETYYEGMEPCGGSSGGLPEYAVAIIAVVAVVAVLGLGFLGYRSMRSKKATSGNVGDGLGGFGAKPSGTL
ncbi:unnamed protein product [Discosporangium mesarthrocarpum]